MRFVAQITLAALFTTLGFSQTAPGDGQERTFLPTHLTSSTDLTAVVTMIRTIANIQDIRVDSARPAIVASGTVDQMMASEWLIHQLDQPASAIRTGVSTDYKMAGPNGEVIRIFRMDAGATIADLTAFATSIRTVADIQRIFPLGAQRAIVARSSLDRIEATDWVFRQLIPAEGQTLSGDAGPYAMKPDRADGDPEEVRILRMDASATTVSMTAMTTAIRTVADIQRIFPYEKGKALILRGPAAKSDVAQWLVHDLMQPTHPSAVVETSMKLDARDARQSDTAVRIFYVPAKSATLTDLATKIRATADIQRIFPYGISNPSAIILRGRPDQMQLVQSLVSKAGPEVRGEEQ